MNTVIPKQNFMLRQVGQSIYTRVGGKSKTFLYKKINLLVLLLTSFALNICRHSSDFN